MDTLTDGEKKVVGNVMHKFCGPILCTLLLLSGCTTYNATTGQATGGFVKGDMYTGLAMGYGSVSVKHMDIVPGQGMHFHSAQYGMVSTNILYEETMDVMSMATGTVYVVREQKPLLQIFGLRFDNPFSNPVMTVEVRQ